MMTVQQFDRAERFLPTHPNLVRLGAPDLPLGTLANISCSGLAVSLPPRALPPEPGTWIDDVCIAVSSGWVSAGAARVARVTEDDTAGRTLVGVAFEGEQPDLILALSPALRAYSYVTHELSDVRNAWPTAAMTGAANDGSSVETLDQYYRADGPDLFAKCKRFRSWSGALQREQIYQRMYRVTVTGALDSRITVFDPVHRKERVLRCFDSNSYLGLHRHPRVVQATRRALSEVGIGTPSAQILCGTNRYLRDLEATLSELHGREDTIVFPTGYAANTGTLSALLREGDAVVFDRHAHASLQEGCRNAPAGFRQRFAHNDVADLDRALSEVSAQGAQGKLVVTDGVFSMHGTVAPLPALLSVCKQHDARLMLDDAHGVGVLGASGRGVEEHFGVDGQVDVLMGTLSKAVGCLGGYVTGDRDLVTYLRWFAASGLFTTTLPAASCAGMREALLVMQEEPEHRASMWENTHYFANSLREIGFSTPQAESPIVTVYIGPQSLLWQVTRRLFDAGVKCAGVMYPAVAVDEAILRFAVNARHTREDLNYTLEAMERVGRELGMLHGAQALAGGGV